MNILDRTIGWVSPAAGLRRQEARRRISVNARNYDAGAPTRHTAGWRRPFTSSRSETYAGLPWLKAGAHDQVRNDPHTAKIVGSLAVDLVGTGILPKANTGNKRLNRKVDALAADFFKAMDADGICANLPAYQLLAARALLEGGEAISRRYRRKSDADLPLPLQFSLLEGEYLDNQLNEGTVGGGRILQGIEFDADNRRTIYHLFDQHPGDAYMAVPTGKRIPVPAADVRLLYEPQRPGQLRGVPWITPMLARARALNDYEMAERERKQLESAIPLVVRSGPDQTAEANDPGITSVFPTVTDVDGNIIERITSGLIAYLRNGNAIETIKPADAMGYGPFKRTELQSVAAGARSTYELASGDLSQTNFSSYQAGHLPYWAMIEVVRATLLIPHFQWIWDCMIEVAVLAGKLPESTPKTVEWFAPPRPPLDPEKQANADLVAIRSGVKTLRQVVVGSGRDFDAHLAEIKTVNKALDRDETILDSDPRKTDKRGVLQALAQDVKGDAPAPVETDPDKGS